MCRVIDRWIIISLIFFCFRLLSRSYFYIFYYYFCFSFWLFICVREKSIESNVIIKQMINKCYGHFVWMHLMVIFMITIITFFILFYFIHFVLSKMAFFNIIRMHVKAKIPVFFCRQYIRSGACNVSFKNRPTNLKISLK